MSEEDRSRLYAWLREQTDEPLAEYLMSCLPVAPLADLVTKRHLEAVLSAEFSAFELRMAAQREADREAMAVQREADREAMAVQREADRKEATAHREAMAVQREADRKEATAHREAMAVQREADRKEATAHREAMAVQREADRKEATAHREADRTTLDRRLRRIAIALPFEIVAALAAVVAVTEWLRG
ncbi:hypothetical protein [Candidatus Poriferisodalis sp.]|uniref:hypothetical protein n=1 Tax=Candidatus Poriferisodalis sp. TaxID=3101277 RepID=UPI003B02BEF0